VVIDLATGSGSAYDKFKKRISETVKNNRDVLGLVFIEFNEFLILINLKKNNNFLFL
jgi:hypothetical protein